MKTTDLRKQQMFVRVRDFGAARRDSFPATSRAGKLFAIVADAALALEQQFSTQAGRRDGVTSTAIARNALRRRLLTIATMARALDLDEPGLADKFRVPLNCGTARLIVLARLFAREARPLAKLFIAHDMPSNFLTALAEETDALSEGASRRNAGVLQSRETRARIDATLANAARAVSQLDAIVLARFQDDPAARASWESARRVDYATRSGGRVPPAPAQLTPAAVPIDHVAVGPPVPSSSAAVIER